MICISSVYANITAPLLSLSSASNLVPNHQFKDGDGNPSLEEWSNTVATSPNSITAVAGTGDNHQVLISKSDVSGSWSDVKMGITWQDIDFSSQEGNVNLILSAKVKASNDDGAMFRFYFRYRTKDGDGKTVNNNVYSDVFDLTSSEQDFIVPIEIPNDAFQWNLDIQFGGSKSGAVADIYFYEPSLTLDTDEEEKPQEPSDPDNLIPDDKFADALGNPTLAVWSNTVATAPNTIQAIEGTTNYNKVLINKVDAITGNWSTLVMSLPWQNISLPQETENVAFELSAKATASNDDGVKFRFNFRYRTPDGEGGFTNHDVNSNQFTLASTEKTFLTSFEIPKDAYQWNVAVQFGGVDSGAPGEITFSHPLLKIVEASGPTDEELVASAKENLAITYASGEDATTVTQDITLPTVGENEVAVSWTSSNSDVISNAGVVTQQEADTDVVLTATLTKNDASDTKEFTVKVLAKEPTDEELVALAKENLKITYADDEGANTVTQDITLPVVGENEVAVSWSSSNIAVVTDAGVVTQQENDMDVVLTATLTRNDATDTKEFTITVLGVGTIPPTDEELVALAKENLEITYVEGEDETSVTQDLTLSTEGENAVVITWSSSNTTVISDEGVVTQQDTDIDVILTATLSKNDASDTKEFTVKVLAYVPTDEELVALAKENLEITFAEGEDENTVTQDITLPINVENDVIVSWSSSDTSILSDAGVVTQPSSDTDVVLTATLSKNEASDTKVFTVKVIGENEPDLPKDDNLIPNYRFADVEGAPSFEEWTKNTAESPNSLDVVAGQDGYNVAVIDKQNNEGNWNALIIGLPWQNIDYSDQEDSVTFKLSAKVKASNDDGAIFRFYFRYRTKDENDEQVNNDIYSDKFTLTSTEEVYSAILKLPKDAYQWNLSVQFGGEESGAPAVISFSYPSFMVDEEDQGPTDQELLAEAVEALEIIFETGDTADAVTQNVTFVSEGLNNTSLNWDASAHSNISNTGEVTISDNAVTANIIATVSLGDLSAQKTFTLTTVATSDDVIVDRVTGRLEVGYAEGDNENAVSQSVTLPTYDDEYVDVQIAWSSSNEAVISNTGELTVPLEVTEVTLTAIISLNETSSTKDFVLTVLNNEEELIQEAFDALEIVFAEGDSAQSVTTDITLKTEGMNNSTIEWISDRTTITSEGVVTRSFRDITTNLTATIQLGSSTLIKEFEVIVMAEEQITSVDNDKAILKLYPNPTFGDITVESSLPIQVIEVFNLIGVKVKTVELNQYSQQKTLNLDDIPNGQYILRVNNQPIKFIKK
ncbi:hypothetical protein AVL50_08115 [Flammeovirga sp. SJP92]|nr:hypothetical protein AVL50_08115 [Flammeovirga sp. SJP92]